MSEFIFITGSFARDREYRKGADIDLIYLTKNSGHVYSESFVTGNVRFQITFMPVYKLVDVITSDIDTPDRIYINLLEGCVPTDDSGIALLTEIKDYIGYMKSQHDMAQDIHVSWQLGHIRELCSEILDERNNAAVIAADLFKTLLTFVTGLPNTMSKHVGRAVAGNLAAEKICTVYTESVTMNDYCRFVSLALSVISPYIGNDRESSTGTSYNQPPKSSLTVFIPGRKSRKLSGRNLMTKLGLCCKGVPFYTFYVGNNQFMECGTYLHVRSNGEISTGVLLDRLYDCHRKLAGICIEEDMKIIFPYRTSFDTGYKFGGKTVFSMLYSVFCKISAISSDCKETGIALGLAVCNIWRTKIVHGDTLLKKYQDSLALNAVDPNCIYNVVQSGYMRCVLREYYDNMEEMEIPPVDAAVLDSLSAVLDDLFNSMQKVDENNIHIVRTPFGDSKKVVVLFNALDHILSIFSLDADEKYAIVHYCLKHVNE